MPNYFNSTMQHFNPFIEHLQKDILFYDLSKLKYVETAGESLNPEVFYRFKEMTVLEIKEGFGQTETVILAAIFSWMKVKQNQDLLVNHRQVKI